MKADRSFKKNSGLEYLTAKGNVREARAMKPIHKCKKNKCHEKLSEDEMISLFQEYWTQTPLLSTTGASTSNAPPAGPSLHDMRKAYVMARIEIKNVANRKKLKPDEDLQKVRTCSVTYNFDVDGRRVKVCRDTFMKVLDETDGFLRMAVECKRKSLSGILIPDQRGRHPPAHKLPESVSEKVKDHIMQYPSYVSHYRRSDYVQEHRYLPTGLKVQDMHQEFLEKVKPPVSLSTYQRIFLECGRKTKPLQTDTCNKCDTYDVQLPLATGEKKQALLQTREEHHKRAELLYDLKKAAKIATMSKPNSRVLVFDLEQVLPTPSLRSNMIFYSRQLNVYNLTVTDTKMHTTHCYMWDESQGERGSNNIASCLTQHTLQEIPEGVEELDIFSDSCVGQNRNSIVTSSMFTILQVHPTLRIIRHICLEVGHTRLECDNSHSTIESIKDKRICETPEDWYNAIRELNGPSASHSYKVTEMVGKFYDFKSLLKSTGPLVLRSKCSTGNKFQWLKTHYFEYRRDSIGKMFFKRDLEEEEATTYLDFRRSVRAALPNFFDILPSLPTRFPIYHKKQEDLRNLYPLLKPTSRRFYESLSSTDEGEDIDPDLARLLGEEEEDQPEEL